MTHDTIDLYVFSTFLSQLCWSIHSQTPSFVATWRYINLRWLWTLLTAFLFSKSVDFFSREPFKTWHLYSGYDDKISCLIDFIYKVHMLIMKDLVIWAHSNEKIRFLIFMMWAWPKKAKLTVNFLVFPVKFHCHLSFLAHTITF